MARAAWGVSCSPATTCLPVCPAAGAPSLATPCSSMSLRSRPCAPMLLMWPSCQLACSLALVVSTPFCVFLFLPSYVHPCGCPCHGTTGPTPPCSRRVHRLQLACSSAWCFLQFLKFFWVAMAPRALCSTLNSVLDFTYVV